MAALSLTQKQQRVLLDIYRNGTCPGTFVEGVASVLEDKGLLEIRVVFRMDLKQACLEMTRMLELNEQQRG